MRNGRGVNYFYYAFLITGAIKRETWRRRIGGTAEYQ
jgi:hypothetical protein